MNNIVEIFNSYDFFSIQDSLYSKAVSLDLFFVRRKIECIDGCLLILGPLASDELEYYIIKDNAVYNDLKDYLERWYD